MNDQEQLVEGLRRVTDALETLSVPDPDQDDLIYQALEKLREARDLAGARV